MNPFDKKESQLLIFILLRYIFLLCYAVFPFEYALYFILAMYLCLPVIMVLSYENIENTSGKLNGTDFLLWFLSWHTVTDVVVLFYLRKQKRWAKS